MPGVFKKLETIPHPGHTSASHLQGYPKGYKDHPARNHPKAVSWLIWKYSKEGDRVWDPMAGAGTMLVEAVKLGRFASGWDVNPKCREFIQALTPDGQALEREPSPGSVDLIITSPAFFDTNHTEGATEKQAENTKKMRSRAGCAYEASKIEGHLGQLRRMEDSVFWWVLGNIYSRCVPLLKEGGHLVLILRDRVMNGEVYKFMQRNRALVEFMGPTLLGGHPRVIPKSARWQQREKLKPGQPHVGVEWNLVFRAPKVSV